MKNLKDKKVSDFYSGWFGIVAALSLLIFFGAGFLPTVEFVTQENLVFAPNLYALFFGFSLKIGAEEVIRDITMFNVMIMIPYLLAIFSIGFCLLMPISSVFGLIAAGLMVAAGVMVTQVGNWNFYANGVRAEYASMLSNAKVTLQPGYFAAFISLYFSAGFTALMSILMWFDGRKKFKRASKSSLGLAEQYREQPRKKKDKKKTA